MLYLTLPHLENKFLPGFICLECVYGELFD